jgi:uncharacterized membrane protein
MKFRWRSEWPHLLLLVGMFALAAAAWNSAPARIPVHWGFSARPDRFGGRVEGLLGLPLETLGLYLLTLFLPRIDPGRANYAAFGSAYATIRLALVAFLAALYGMMHLRMRGSQIAAETLMPLAIGAVLVVIGNLLPKLRPNWFVGIRTPWTLSSKLAWTHTHRAGGWLCITVGVLMMITTLVRTEWAIVGPAVAGGVAVLGLVVYSYVLWRRDPDKTPPAGTLPADEA